jgi:hypothetical protein
VKTYVAAVNTSGIGPQPKLAKQAYFRHHAMTRAKNSTAWASVCKACLKTQSSATKTQSFEDCLKTQSSATKVQVIYL